MPKFNISEVKHTVTEYEIEAEDYESAYEKFRNEMNDEELDAAKTNYEVIFSEIEINETID